MAQVVIGVGTSHSPQLSIRAKDWAYLLKKDETDPRLDYQGLLKRAKPGIQSELGESDPWSSELSELRTRIESAGLPEEVQVRALKEIERGRL